MDEVLVRVPLRVTANRVKKAGGPYARIKGHYYILLALRVAGFSYRWEPHLVIDRTGTLGEEGIVSVAGPVVLLEYNGYDTVMELARGHGITTLYLPKWGFPAILLFHVEELGEDDLALLDMAGLSKAKSLLKELKNQLKIEES